MFVCAVGLCLAASAAEVPDPDPIAERVMAAFEVPGMAVAVVKNDELVYARGYGVRSIDTGEPVTPETIFSIGSNGKSFTSAAVAVLVDRGVLSWDDVVAEKLPGYRLYDTRLTYEATFRDHLSMRTGLGDQAGINLWYGVDRTRDEVLHQLRYIEPTYPFRTTFAYSNVSIVAAGQAVAAVSGMSCAAFVRKNLFEPLRMTSTDTLLAELESRDNVAAPHERIDGQIITVPRRSADNAAPAGSITSNVLDMANWLRFQLGDGTFEGNVLVDAKVFHEMHIPHTVIRPDSSWGMLFPDSNILSYGFCWFVVDVTGRKVVLHGGSIDGMNALMVMVPAEKLGVMVLTNINLGHAHSLAFLREYLDQAVADSGVDWVEQALAFSRMGAEAAAKKQAEIEALRDPSRKPSLALSAYAGSYLNRLHGAATVSFADGQLTIARGPGFEGRLDHWYGDTFRADWGQVTVDRTMVTFTVSSGDPVACELQDLGVFSREQQE